MAGGGRRARRQACRRRERPARVRRRRTRHARLSPERGAGELSPRRPQLRGEELAPRVDELEETETFPKDLFRDLGRLGYLGVGYPEEYGGSGGDMVMRCLLIEEIARINCGFAAALLAHVGLGCIPVFRFGTEEQKQAYLVPAIHGDKLGSFGLSEPNSGSDAASIRTRAPYTTGSGQGRGWENSLREVR